MDVTELEVEVACWAQNHPDASLEDYAVESLIPNCKLRFGLGGLTWSIEIPTGYQTEIDTVDGNRKRVWDPLDHRDMVIVQSRSISFQVSIADESNNTLKLFNGLDKVVANSIAAGSCDKDQREMVRYMLRALQLESIPEPLSEGADISLDGYLEALKGAETLTEVLDSIHWLANFYNERNLSSRTECPDDPDSRQIEDEERVFDITFDDCMCWKTIEAEVNYAQKACEEAFARSGSLRESVDSDVESAFISRENLRGLSCSSRSSGSSSSEAVFPHSLGSLGDQDGRADSCDNDDDYTLLPRSLADSNDICESSTPERNDQNSSELITAEDTFRDDLDIDKSDSSWEILDVYNQKATSNGEADGERRRKLEQTYSSSLIAAQSQLEAMWPRDQATKRETRRERAKSLQGSDHRLPPKRIKLEQSDWDSRELKWCDIALDQVTFSIECTLRLSEFMDNPTVATALGFRLELPLKVRIVPNKVQICSLEWRGDVEVYVSQLQSDFHNHISEEICASLYLVPWIVQNYLHDKVPIFNDSNYGFGTIGHKGHIFVGLLHTLVRRLKNLNAGDSCCVCGKLANRRASCSGEVLWSCCDNLCQATYTTWNRASSVQLCLMEEKLRDTFEQCENLSCVYCGGTWGCPHCQQSDNLDEEKLKDTF